MQIELKELINRYQDAMNRVYRNVNIIMKDKIHSDITTDQFSTLQYIQKHKQCTSTDIAHEFGVGKSAVTAQINRLYEKGLIERNRDESDRRNVYLHVTEKGIELVHYTEDEVYAAIGKNLTHFDDEEIQSFIRSLEKLASVMDNDQRGVNS
ncbi:MarR family winged helix-turn-helix transcriptional regulator [Virgibacillus oceani]|uniref:Transcriptional regulator n=1 Tax=Virgibacillus oceani TaxID=1479511 RepID=A0A917M8Y1_9BACI|nr:MarR family transcriptional regulator [Virgibacillus oceani]GGG85252.1 transcriptional regulator [Virgibacillus oceani]